MTLKKDDVVQRIRYAGLGVPIGAKNFVDTVVGKGSQTHITLIGSTEKYLASNFKVVPSETQTRHCHSDLIHLWAEGETIQRLEENGEFKDAKTILWLEDSVYRVKPSNECLNLEKNLFRLKEKEAVINSRITLLEDQLSENTRQYLFAEKKLNELLP